MKFVLSHKDVVLGERMSFYFHDNKRNDVRTLPQQNNETQKKNALFSNLGALFLLS